MTSNLPGFVLLILIVAVPLALLASVALLRLYRRAVLRAMRTRAHVETSESLAVERSPLIHEPAQIQLDIVVLDSASTLQKSSTADGLYAELIRGPWRASAIYAIAGLSYALVTTIIFLIATKSGFHLLGFLITFWYYAWPVIVTICLVAAATWRTRLIIFAVYFGTIVVLGALTVVNNSSSNWMEIIFLWVLTNFPAALLLLLFINRRFQAVGPLVLTFMLFAVTGSVLFPRIAANNLSLLRWIVHLGVSVGLGGFGIFVGLTLLGFILFGAVGWLVLQRIGRWYQQKKISAHSITMDAVWLLFGIFQSIGLIFEGERWFLISLLAFAIYKIVSLVGFSLLRNQFPTPQQRLNLLMLRVFSLGKRSERLFDVLAMYWRYIGNIQLIAGPDLATTTMEPHEFLEFLSGKLARRFIDNAQALDLRISKMDLAPDYDGQFRVNDFFCHDDTWRMVLSRLVGESDAVLMDVRGFSSQNAGCIFEITELINVMLLEKVLFIIDGTTDEPFLRQTIQQSWDRMKSTSPNRLSKSGLLRMFRLGSLQDRELQQILQVLSLTATAQPNMLPST
jgi:hypothetical protein